VPRGLEPFFSLTEARIQCGGPCPGKDDRAPDAGTDGRSMDGAGSRTELDSLSSLRKILERRRIRPQAGGPSR
jgi:hypothetical protein